MIHMLGKDIIRLHAGWLIDGSGRPPENDVLITIADGRIQRLTGVDTPGSGGIAPVEDLSRCTVMPGLIDSHVHLFMSGTHDLVVRERQLEADFDTVREAITRRLGKCLENGIIAVRDGGDRHGHALAYKQEVLDPRALPVAVSAAGRAWRRGKRYGRLIGRPPDPGRGLSGSIRNSRESVDHVKIVNSGLNSLVRFGRETPPQFSLEEMTAAVAAAKEMGLKTMVHANGRVPVDIAVRAGCDSIEHGFFMGRDNLERMAERQVVWVPTAGTMRAYIDFMQKRVDGSRGGEQPAAGDDILPAAVEGARRNLEHQLEQISAAEGLGVPIAAGTDAGSPGVNHGTFLHEEIGILMEAGLSVQAAVKSATSIGARLLDMAQGGSIEKGAPATFIAVRGTPEAMPQSLGAIDALFIEGRRWSGESRCRITNDRGVHA